MHQRAEIGPPRRPSFDADLRDHVDHVDHVRAQRQGGARACAASATFYVNGRRFDGDVDARVLVAALRGNCF